MSHARTSRGDRAAILLLAMGMLATWAGAAAGLQQTEFRAKDGTAYQLLRTQAPLAPGADRDRVTTIGGAMGIGGCNVTESGSTASAIGGVLIPGQVLHPFNSISRTTVLGPNDITSASFDETGSGHVTLGSGAGALHICRVASDCPGGTSEALVGLGTADANVPAACISNGLQALCEATNTRNAFGFGLAASGNPPTCTNPATVNTMACAAQPADGFTLDFDEAIVFVYNGTLGGMGFGVAAGGFSIDSNAVGSSCPSGGVIAANGRLDSQPAPGGAPTPRATSTATPMKTPNPSGPPRQAPASSPLALAVIAAALALWGVLRLSRFSD